MRRCRQIACVLSALAFATEAGAQPLPADSHEPISALIRQLDADRYETREQASRALAELGLPALPALQQAAVGGSTEVRWRARAIVLELTEGPRRRELIAFCSQSDERLDLEYGMWLIARIVDPAADRAAVGKQLDELADKVRLRIGKGVDPASVDPQVAVSALRQVLFADEHFTGNQDDYYHPDNSAINRVLATRKGLPILLSHVTIAVARRLKIPIAGVPVSPYIVKYDGARAPAGFPKDDIYFHPFEEGRVLSREDRAKEFAGDDPDRLEPEGPRREMLTRMLRNLTSACKSRGLGEMLERAEELEALLEAFAPAAAP